MQNYARLIGIDVGRKRCGLAQTDLLQTIASPLGTFSPDEIINKISHIVEGSPVEGIVVGWPLTPNGEEGEATRMVQEFINRLKNLHPDIPVFKVDERYTSNQAVDVMVKSGIPKNKRREKERVDRIAAALILQSYLDSKH
ncbi:MAG: Holliday junction resolvase RuvX [Balneola sp.]|nr:Holliday junction resolvase RuvX [Balneola sp.]MBO6650837.1 Holliday junction resolvase RuvX [Balneola sp.]MBO6710054.1 Holliday junction resolvase RuvX [Balneola sp.]MBO6798738.1 Holliday junction resolvase RuvX [Balneola sp.]MBO6869852.1 Holliday junction resolvase RuvX [Balneola sp.]